MNPISRCFSIGVGSFLRSTYGLSIPIRLQIGEAGDGDIGIQCEKATESENLERYISFKVEYVLIQSSMNLTTSEQTSCGVEEKQLQEKMRNAMQRSLMKLSESLFENYERENPKYDYEQKKQKTNKDTGFGHSITYGGLC